MQTTRVEGSRHVRTPKNQRDLPHFHSKMRFQPSQALFTDHWFSCKGIQYIYEVNANTTQFLFLSTGCKNVYEMYEFG